MKSFFGHSDSLDRDVLRPLSHILPYWEATWDAAQQKYSEEDGRYAVELNTFIDELAAANPPAKYHDNEDSLAKYVVKHLKWPIRKQGKRWVGANYDVILQQGGFHDIDERDLVFSAGGCSPLLSARFCIIGRHRQMTATANHALKRTGSIYRSAWSRHRAAKQRRNS